MVVWDIGAWEFPTVERLLRPGDVYMSSIGATPRAHSTGGPGNRTVRWTAVKAGERQRKWIEKRA